VLSPLLSPHTRILDIGMSALPRLLRRRFPEVSISTLGFMDARYWTPGEWTHFECDLNDPEFPWASVGTYEIIILAEVIEHLYTPPQKVLGSLRRLLKPGGWLVIQTPNAASLEKRLKLLWGGNPYEMIRETPDNPGHYREYTVSELRALVKSAGFCVTSVSITNYFSPTSVQAGIYNWVCRLLPQSLHDGITMLLLAI
jgi:SAM-dependent methyltransferase